MALPAFGLLQSQCGLSRFTPFLHLTTASFSWLLVLDFSWGPCLNLAPFANSTHLLFYNKIIGVFCSRGARGQCFLSFIDKLSEAIIFQFLFADRFLSW